MYVFLMNAYIIFQMLIKNFKFYYLKNNFRKAN